MFEREHYVQMISLKRELAKTVGLPLVVVGPTDMHRLADIFAAHLQSKPAQLTDEGP